MELLNIQSQKTLEFEEVKDIISSFSHWSGGREEIHKMQPMDDSGDVYELQNKIRQIQEINTSGDDISVGGFEDLTHIVNAAEKGSSLNAGDFTPVAGNLKIISALKKSLLPWVQMPFIFETVQSLYALPQLLQSIEQVFDESGNIRDRASTDLFEIRESIKNTELAIHSRLSSLLRDMSQQKMFQELLYTIREGRYVVPIKQEFRGIFDGLVLDMSTSGATVFMEPMGIVEHNNMLRQQRAEEKSELDRIIRNLSNAVGRYKRELLQNQNVVSEFDKIHALSLFADKHKCILPMINKSGHLLLKKARHPLLGEKAIPLDLELGKEFYTIVITGPNTGGKTVALKTAGLFTLMGLAAMPLPAEEGTEIPLFSGVFADIGDDQSITQNLSTFSSHMNRIISIVNSCKADSLILLDELGAGTDPREGSAIGIALLEHLTSLGARTIITTHYGELKYFASNHPRACNAAMEFDNKTLLPSYKIITGLPGRSCALTIAGRLGLPEKLISRAEELLSHEYVEMDRMLANIESKEKHLEEELSLHKKYKTEAMNLKEKYEEEMSLIKTEQLEIITDSAAEAELMVTAAKSEIQKILKNFNQRLKTAEKSKNRAAESSNEATESVGKLNEILARLEAFKQKRGVKKTDYETEFKPGDEVFIPSMNKNAVILEIKDDDVLIQINRIKQRLHIWNIKPMAKTAEQTKGQKQNQPDTDIILKKIPASVNLIGLYVDEAIYRLEKYIDEAVAEQLDTFQVVHGRGTGALRSAVHQFLRKNPLVENYRLGESREGSDGVTVVTLK